MCLTVVARLCVGLPVRPPIADPGSNELRVSRTGRPAPRPPRAEVDVGQENNLYKLMLIRSLPLSLPA